MSTKIGNISFKQKLGAAILDAPRFLWRFAQSKLSKKPYWLFICDRDNKLLKPNSGYGVKCDWVWTSNLYLPTVFPWFGNALLKMAINEHSINFKAKPSHNNAQADVSFIIGHRGEARTPLLLKTLSSIAAQRNCDIECIVVEQDTQPHLSTVLPSWVKHIVSTPATSETPYSRAWAFNVGVKHASAECVILHDNDLLVSHDYARETLRIFKQGYEFINLKRFIFYLSKKATDEVLKTDAISSELELESIMQNAEGGGSIGASKKAYSAIGGFDQRFVGWGGEDNEFWERAQTRQVWLYTSLPLIHLWHGAQKEKLASESNANTVLYQELAAKPVEQRIKELTAKESQQCVE